MCKSRIDQHGNLADFIAELIQYQQKQQLWMSIVRCLSRYLDYRRPIPQPSVRISVRISITHSSWKSSISTSPEQYLGCDLGIEQRKQKTKPKNSHLCQMGKVHSTPFPPQLFPSLLFHSPFFFFFLVFPSLCIIHLGLSPSPNHL